MYRIYETFARAPEMDIKCGKTLNLDSTVNSFYPVEYCLLGYNAL
jgi:hypothetical protein